ncbi:DUF4238 domain-containing protein [Bradyrhizobium diazoefficiens]|uniref:DUF4238 domain-containing protein n=2 Tax=Bradyrhizobium diazoefficiens TaxID=1355477 RepID=A0A809ZVE7_9BRAD|nr:DUF4238 domain-containing protein [Bradyrhizobium diazoefficiens]QLD44382.1 DUF4238 domain-containing protein [Bradyrhizobium diazoefficiens]BCE56622.1 hypothetical protein XF5B_41340 [Bradyrhizobium diazoefficiens]
MVQHKDQHWVPRSYLEAWTDPNALEHYEPYVHLFDRTGNQHRKKSPAKILHMPDLYTIFDGTTRDLTIEHTFSQWEDAFVKVRKKIEADTDLTEEDVANLYVFAGALMVRPPHYIEHFASQWRDIVAKARSIKINPKAKPMKSFTDGPSLSLDEAQRYGDDPMGTWFRDNLAANIEVLAERFGFDLLVNQSEHPFLTSDAPAVTYHPPLSKRFRFFPRGLGSPGCEVTLPISPRYALLFRHKEPGLHKYLVADWESVFEMNFRTITRAKEKIVSDRPDLFFVKTILDRVAEVEAEKQRNGANGA